jgi:glutaredoxin
MPWTWLGRWWRRWHKPRLGHWQVVVYTRQGCHLCEQAWAQLDQARRDHGFALDTVDVDTDPDLVSRYGGCVPVVLVNGRVRFRGRVNPVLLRRLFSERPA